MKTFIKQWVSTLGVLLFIILLGSVVLGMLSTPLQLNSTISRVWKNSEKYDYRLRDRGDYTEDFTYHFFLMSGKKYTESTADQPIQVLKQLDTVKPFTDEEFAEFIEKLRNGEWTSERPTYFSPSTYLFLDKTMTDYVKGHEAPGDIASDTWYQILKKLHAGDLKTPSYEYATTLSRLLNSWIEIIIFNAQKTATQSPYSFSFKDNTAAEKIIGLFLKDLRTNLMIEQAGENYFNDFQQLYLVNSFLKINGSKIVVSDVKDISDDEWWKKLAAEIKGKDKQTITPLAFTFLDAVFLEEILFKNHNNITEYLISNALSNENNSHAFDPETHQQLFDLNAAIEFTLSKMGVGTITPELIVGVRNSEFEASFNKIVVETGTTPKQPNLIDEDVPIEIMLSSSFMHLNNLKIGDLILLPDTPTFANNVDKRDREAFKISHQHSAKIVGTALKYDELTPGEDFLDYVQPFKSYTYGYIPGQYLKTYIKSKYIYDTPTKKDLIESVLLNFRVKNLGANANLNPLSALAIDENKSEQIFTGTEEMLETFNSVSTVTTLGTINVQVLIYIILGIASLFLAFIFINFVIKKEINETRRQLGIFKSFGYTTKELSLIFAIKTLITIFLGIIFGWLGSIPVQIYMAKNFENSVIFFFNSVYLNVWFLLIIFLVIPAAFFLISYLITLKYISEPVLILVRNEQRIKDRKPKAVVITDRFERRSVSFNYRLSQNFIKNSRGKFTVIQLLFLFSALVYTMMFGAQALMYQTISQGFSLITDGTDHEYTWDNPDDLVINEASKGKYTLETLSENKQVSYLDYQGFENPNEAMLKMQDSNRFSNARFGFRILTDSIANEYDRQVRERNSDDSFKDWILMPENVALERYAGKKELYPKNNYYLVRFMSFKGLDDSYNVPQELQEIIQNYFIDPIKTSDEYNKDIDKLFQESRGLWFSPLEWRDIRDVPDKASILLKRTLLGMLPTTTKETETIYNNFFLTDLSRFFSMVFSEFYINQKIIDELKDKKVDGDGNYSADDVRAALKKVYRDFYNNPTVAKYNPRDSKYWKILNNPFLQLDLGPEEDVPPLDDIDIFSVLANLDSEVLSVINAALLTESVPDPLLEPVVNFNNFFFNSQKEHLQLQLSLASSKDSGHLGLVKLNLVDTEKNRFGSVKNQYNFENVSDAEFNLLKEKPLAKNTFNGIVPYTIAKRLKIEKGDQIKFYTSTQSRQEITINVVAINDSITFPLNLSWPIFLDYNVFAEEMFSDDLKEIINHEDKYVHSYYFNNLVSQEKMLLGNFDLYSVVDSLATFQYAGNQLVLNIENDAQFFGAILQDLIGILAPDQKEKFAAIFTIDPHTKLLNNPSMMDLVSQRIISIPYNIVQNGVHNFTKTMNNLMFIFLLLQSVLLTIILMIVMNIVIDEAAAIILTLRSLGMSQKEINWIIMGPYTFGALISYIFACVLSLITWKVFLIVVENKWNLYIFFPFSWQGIVIPFLVLGTIIFIGFLTANYNVNRRPLVSVTNFA